MKRASVLVALALAGCGKATTLRPAAGETLPPAAYGTAVRPTSDELTTPPTQARPERSDELLRSSQDRRDDKFDLPPPD